MAAEIAIEMDRKPSSVDPLQVQKDIRTVMAEFADKEKLKVSTSELRKIATIVGTGVAGAVVGGLIGIVAIAFGSAAGILFGGYWTSRSRPASDVLKSLKENKKNTLETKIKSIMEEFSIVNVLSLEASLNGQYPTIEKKVFQELVQFLTKEMGLKMSM